MLTSADADTNIAIGGGSTLALLTELGLTVGTTNATNLLTQGAVDGRPDLEVQRQSAGARGADQRPLTVTFGNRPGQVSTMAELTTALGGTHRRHRDRRYHTATSLSPPATMTDTITVGGTATPSVFGIHTLTALPSNGTVIANDVSHASSTSRSAAAPSPPTTRPARR